MPPLTTELKQQLHVITICQTHGGKEESNVFNF